MERRNMFCPLLGVWGVGRSYCWSQATCVTPQLPSPVPGAVLCAGWKWGSGTRIQPYCTSLICFLPGLQCIVLVILNSLFFPLEVFTFVEKAVRGIPCKARASRGCSSCPTSLQGHIQGDEGLRAPPQGGRVSPGVERVGHNTACDKRHASRS